MSEEAADPDMREVAAEAYASLLRVKGHASSSDLAGSVTEEVGPPALTAVVATFVCQCCLASGFLGPSGWLPRHG